MNKFGIEKSENNLKRVLKQFPAGRQKEIKKIWMASGRSVRSPEVTGAETEEALASVHRRLESRGAQTATEPKFRLVTLRRLLAAAVLLMVFGALFFAVPRTISVPYGQTASLGLPDGSTVLLNSGTVIRFNRLFSFTNRSVQLDGEAFFTVAGADLPFIVRANESVIEVTGTRFNVRSWSDEPGGHTEVSVFNGSVGFYPVNRRHRRILLTEGEISRWNPLMDEPSRPNSAVFDREPAWSRNVLAFNEQPLTVILRELERKFDVQIDLEAPALGRQTLTTYYNDPADAETILKDICTVKGLRYAKTANGFRVYK